MDSYLIKKILTGFTGFNRILFKHFQIPPARLGQTQAAGRKLEIFNPLSAEYLPSNI